MEEASLECQQTSLWPTPLEQLHRFVTRVNPVVAHCSYWLRRCDAYLRRIIARKTGPIKKGHCHRVTVAVALYIFPLRLPIPLPSKYPVPYGFPMRGVAEKGQSLTDTGSHRRKRVDGRGPFLRCHASIQTSVSKARWATDRKFLASSFSESKTRRSSAPCRTAAQSRRSAASSIWSRMRSIRLWNLSLAIM